MLTVNYNRLPPWGSGNARKIIDALGGADYVLAVGGCVRDWLTDHPVKDIDFATKHFPKKSFQILKNKGFDVKPIGIEHGTIAVLVNNINFQITSLRKDILTDGRHALVKFGGDWVEDANRRDFTLNALYADEQGTVYDPLGKGFKDLEDKKLCFIGDPKKRIKEDYLRIIRYFRFLSRFSENIDESSISSCIKEARKICLLSGERISSEISKILVNKNGLYAFKEMQRQDLLKYIFTKRGNYSLYIEDKILESFFKHVSIKHHSKKKLIILISLLLKQNSKQFLSEKIIYSISDKFHFSKNDTKLLFRNIGWIKNINLISVKDIQLLWLDYGKNEVEDLKLILKILNFKKFNTFREAFDKKPPLFPCSGQDAKRIGFAEGDELGAVLKTVREWWLENDCTASHEECMAQLEKKFKAMKPKGAET